MGVLLLAVTFAGCFLGAGYVSGQEIWQFFGGFGLDGIWGLLLAVLLQCFFGNILFRLVADTGIEELDKVVIWQNAPAVRAFVGASEVVFLFGICVIMYAGAGALIEQTIGIPAAYGSAALSMLVAVSARNSFNGMVYAFSVLVPLIVVFTLAISVAALVRYGFPAFSETRNGSNPLMGSWIISALTFVSYNLFCSIGILAPMAKHVRTRSSITLGIGLGSIFLLFIATSIIFALSAHLQSVPAQLPMLALASDLNRNAGIVYALLLLGSMFGAGLSCLVATVEYLGRKSQFIFAQKPWLIAGLSLVAWLGSLIGFGKLIGIIYPLCGYCGFGALISILVHYFNIRRELSSHVRCNNKS